MASDFTVHEAPAQTVVSRRLLVVQPEMGATLSTTFEKAYKYLGATGLTPAGPPFVIYHGHDGDEWDVEICAPYVGVVVPGVNLPEGFEARRLPAEQMLQTVHRGPYEGLGEAYAHVAEWAEANGYEFSGPPREAYLSPPGTPPAETETIIDQPVARVPVGVLA